MRTLSRILICDDEPLMTDSIKKMLDRDGYRVQTTNHPAHALTLIHAGSPDLVILDVMMPEMTGFEVLGAFDKERCDPDFIIITGKASVDSAIEAMRRGASDYLRKPFEPDELIFRVEKVLHQRKMRLKHQCIMVEKLRLEKQLHQAQKMEAIGTLAGGIAHDFNNILGIILGNAELAFVDINKNHPVHHNLDQILSASLRAREMVQQLLNFSRAEDTGRKPSVLNEILSDSLDLMRASLPSNIAITRKIDEQRCTTMADATQVHQIVMNLCTNAFHAMETDGGVLSVRMEPVELDPFSAVDVDGIKPGRYARLVVSDTGNGIEKKVIDKIFDPYFTTKKTGEGTGMGLSIVHGIVTGNGGAINVFSRPGRFTEFHVYLPLMDMDIDEEPDIDDQQQLPGGQEHILLVDDEKLLVDMMKAALEQLGYTVTAHTESTEAFKAFLSAPHSYDLLLTDMTMPQMMGTDLVKAVREERKDVPIVLCTGFSEQITEEKAFALGIQALILKPVGIKELADTIRNVLSSSTMERRKHPRFVAQAGAYVISHGHPYERNSLVDISQSGLAYHHHMTSPFGESVDHLAIMTPKGEMFVSDLKCHTVSNVQSLQSQANQTRRSVCFENLTGRQSEKIKKFIDLHTDETIR